MEKIIISKRHLDCVKKQRENARLSSCFLDDFDAKLKRSIELREEFSDIILFSPDNKFITEAKDFCVFFDLTYKIFSQRNYKIEK